MTRTLRALCVAAVTLTLSLGSSPASAAQADGTPVRVASASWVTADAGWVLGTTGCAAASCTTIARTVDGGSTWTEGAAPPAPLAPSGGDGVDEVHLADPRNGWAFYPRLYATHDGAGSWRRVPVPGGGTQVLSLTSSGGYAYAVVSTCVIGNPSDCTGPASVWRTPVSTDRWTRVPVTLPASGFPVLSASATSVYLTGRGPSGAPYLLASVGGGGFTPRPVPCADPSISGLRVAPAGGANVLLLCSENVGLGAASKVPYASTDAARTTVLRTEAPTDGQPLGTAAAGQVALIGVSGAGSQILRSGDAGGSWTLGYQGPSETVAVQLVGTTGSVVSGPAHYPRAAGDLLLSHDGGLTWAVTPVTVPFRATGAGPG